MTAMGDSSKEPEVSEITFPDHLNAVNASYMDFFVNEKFTDILLGSSGGKKEAKPLLTETEPHFFFCSIQVPSLIAIKLFWQPQVITST